MNNELCYLTISEAHKGLVEKKFSCKDLVMSCLQQIDKHQDDINAFITVTAELALKQAEQIDTKIAKGEGLGYLEGIPIGIKDIFCTKGIETTAASNILRSFIPPYDSTVVKRLKDAGVVIMGKLNHDAFAHGSSGENSDFAPTHNPWNLEYSPGGSSSGSAAALAAGMCLAATGTDTGSSIRLPASFCNLTGLKPTYGRVSRYGVIAMASSLDSPGALTRTAIDQSIVLNCISGKDLYDATTAAKEKPLCIDKATLENSNTLRGLRVGVPKEYFIDDLDFGVEKLTRKAVDKLTELGAEVQEISLPHTDYALAVYYIIVSSEVSSNLARFDGIRYGHSRDNFGDEAKRRIMLGTFALSSGYYDAYYEKAQKVRTLVKRDFEQAFEKVDIIAAPSSPTPPFKLGEKKDPLQMYLSDVLMTPVNLAGIPALNIPCGFVNSLPVGFQLIGPQWSEEQLLLVGAMYQMLTDWHKKFPTLLK